MTHQSRTCTAQYLNLWFAVGELLAIRGQSDLAEIVAALNSTRSIALKHISAAQSSHAQYLVTVETFMGAYELPQWKFKDSLATERTAADAANVNLLPIDGRWAFPITFLNGYAPQFSPQVVAVINDLCLREYEAATDATGISSRLARVDLLTTYTETEETVIEGSLFGY